MTVFVLLTAMPPTKGHLHLVQFAKQLGHTKVLLCTQPGEPFAEVRAQTFTEAVKPLGVTVRHIHKTLEQNPDAMGFWEMWKEIMLDHGAKPGDIVVSSEAYGLKLAETFGGQFIPYDLNRDIYDCKATRVRDNSITHFDLMIPEFQHYIRQTVTFFGAESTGKTTLSRILARAMNAHWLFEWARPYLETCGTEITTDSMTAIWKGQQALQDHAVYLTDKPWLIQDTDLFSTVGYWDFWNMETPKQLKFAAEVRKSNLYLITQSNIPFEIDPIRYGGDKRESTDQYWIDLCDKYALNYIVLQESTLENRVKEATEIMLDHWKKKVSDKLAYERVF